MELNEILEKIDNNQWGDLSLAQWDEALTALSDKPEYASYRQAIADYKASFDDIDGDEIGISDEQFAQNAENLRKIEDQTTFGDDAKAAFDKIEVVDNGEVQNINLMDEIIDAAKLKVKVDSVEEEAPLTTDEYTKRLQQEIASILSTMIVVKPAGENEENNLTDAEQRSNAVQNIFDPEFKGKVQIDKQAAGAGFANTMGHIASKVQDFAQKYTSKEFFDDVADKFNNLDQRLDDKLEQAYTKSKAVVANMIQTGSWKQAAGSLALAGTAFVAAGTAVGVGAMVGLTGLTAYMTYQRGKEFWKGFKAEKPATETCIDSFKAFGKYAGNHKMELTRVALYVAATAYGADAVWHSAEAVYNAAEAVDIAASAGAEGAEAVAEAQVAAQAAQEAAKAATLGKMGMLTTAAAMPYASDTAVAISKRDWKKARSSAAKTAAVVGGSLGLYWLLGGSHDAHAAEGNMTEVDSTNTVKPVVTDSLQADTTNTVKPVVTDSLQADTTHVQPVADGADAGTDAGTADNDTHAEDAAAQVHQYTTDEVGAREQHFYEKRLAIVPRSDEMVLNVKDGLVQLPENMTPEQAVHLAAMEKLYYGNEEALQALLNCDEIHINTEEYFAQLHDKFVTQMGDPRGLMGYPTDPNYVADPNIRARITGVNCDDVTISRTVHHSAPIEKDPFVPVDEVPEAPDTQAGSSTQQEVHIFNLPDADNIDASQLESEPLIPAEDNKNMGWQHIYNLNEADDLVKEHGIELESEEIPGAPSEPAVLKSNEAGQILGEDGKPMNGALTAEQLNAILSGGKSL